MMHHRQALQDVLRVQESVVNNRHILSRVRCLQNDKKRGKLQGGSAKEISQSSELVNRSIQATSRQVN